MICQFAAVSPAGNIVEGTVSNSVEAAWNRLILDADRRISMQTRDARQEELRANGYRIASVWVSVTPPAEEPQPSPPAGTRREQNKEKQCTTR